MSLHTRVGEYTCMFTCVDVYVCVSVCVTKRPYHEEHGIRAWIELIRIFPTMINSRRGRVFIVSRVRGLSFRRTRPETSETVGVGKGTRVVGSVRPVERQESYTSRERKEGARRLVWRWRRVVPEERREEGWPVSNREESEVRHRIYTGLWRGTSVKGLQGWLVPVSEKIMYLRGKTTAKLWILLPIKITEKWT